MATQNQADDKAIKKQQAEDILAKFFTSSRAFYVQKVHILDTYVSWRFSIEETYHRLMDLPEENSERINFMQDIAHLQSLRDTRKLRIKDVTAVKDLIEYRVKEDPLNDQIISHYLKHKPEKPLDWAGVAKRFDEYRDQLVDVTESFVNSLSSDRDWTV